MSALLDLAARVEAASDNMQGMMLEEAWETLAEHSAEFRAFATTYQRGFDNKAGKFTAALEAEAYLSAAFMLVPKFFKVNEFEQQGAYNWRWRCWLLRPIDAEGIAHAYAPALALCAAALRAEAQS